MYGFEIFSNICMVLKIFSIQEPFKCYVEPYNFYKIKHLYGSTTFLKTLKFSCAKNTYMTHKNF